MTLTHFIFLRSSEHDDDGGPSSHTPAPTGIAGMLQRALQERSGALRFSSSEDEGGDGGADDDDDEWDD